MLLDVEGKTVCGICQSGRTFHDDCTFVAIRWGVEGRYDIEYYPPFAVRLLQGCYLCGAANSSHAEHLVPRARYGSDLWSNVGGACARCNAHKGDRVTELSPEQVHRFEEHQRLLRAAFGRVNDLLVAEALATRVRRKAYPSGDAFGDQDRALLDMRVLMWETGLSWEQMNRWLRGGLDLMLRRGWLKPEPTWPVDEAVPEHVTLAMEEEQVDSRHRFIPRPPHTPR
jgi:hypothetical protein